MRTNIDIDNRLMRQAIFRTRNKFPKMTYWLRLRECQRQVVLDLIFFVFLSCVARDGGSLCKKRSIPAVPPERHPTSTIGV